MTPGRELRTLGIDIGSSVVKAVVADLEGRELAVGRASTPWLSCPTGAEIDAPRLLDAALAAAREALRGLPAASIAGVGVSSFAESLVLLDGSGAPIAPVIAWYDGRGAAEADELGDRLGHARFSSRSGLPVSPLCSVAKLAWLHRHLDTASDARRALSVAEWVVHELGGEQASELSLASRTGCFDVVASRWWDEPLEWAGYRADLFPPALPAGTRIGSVTAPPSGLEAARGASLAVGGHDHLCAAAGAGVTAPGQVLDSCGTAEALLRATTPLAEAAVLGAVRDGISVSRHVVRGHEALMGGMPFGRVLAAVRDLLGQIPEPTGPPPEGGDGRAWPGKGKGDGDGGLRVGIDPNNAVVLSGIVAGVTPQDAWRAAADAVLARSFVVYDRLEELGGPVDLVVLTGGWSAVEPVQHEKLARFPRTVRPIVAEAGGRGAALFGACAAGLLAGAEAFPSPAYEEIDPVLGG